MLDPMVMDAPHHLVWVDSTRNLLRSRSVIWLMLQCASPAACAITVNLTLISTSSDGTTTCSRWFTDNPASFFLRPDKHLSQCGLDSEFLNELPPTMVDFRMYLLTLILANRVIGYTAIMGFRIYLLFLISHAPILRITVPIFITSNSEYSKDICGVSVLYSSGVDLVFQICIFSEITVCTSSRLLDSTHVFIARNILNDEVVLPQLHTLALQLFRCWLRALLWRYSSFSTTSTNALASLSRDAQLEDICPPWEFALPFLPFVGCSSQSIPSALQKLSCSSLQPCRFSLIPSATDLLRFGLSLMDFS
ncbi:Uncharacterized protein PBTT_10278 [Plasmodiophora brassicae]|uniref:Uncharacterized protein n=1 Tax=Plasmodiophora brassicae TaxID=37360 RepID=A0A0G4J4M4_PLABS|nr:hypothetical protein PBRA_009109 [Plasmodiophora brassicae]